MPMVTATNAAQRPLQQGVVGGAVIDTSEALQRIAYPRRVGSQRRAGLKIRPARSARETLAWQTVYQQGLPPVLQMFPPPAWEQLRWSSPQLRILAAYGVAGWLARIV